MRYVARKREALRYFSIECSIALFVALLINVACVSVFAVGFYSKPGVQDLGLENAGKFLGAAFGQPVQYIWAIGLLAAGTVSWLRFRISFSCWCVVVWSYLHGLFLPFFCLFSSLFSVFIPAFFSAFFLPFLELFWRCGSSSLLPVGAVSGLGFVQVLRFCLVVCCAWVGSARAPGYPSAHRPCSLQVLSQSWFSLWFRLSRRVVGGVLRSLCTISGLVGDSLQVLPDCLVGAGSYSPYVRICADLARTNAVF